MSSPPRKLAVLFSSGGLSDVGRHAVQVALERVEQVTVLTPRPETLYEENWNCGCTEPHSFSPEDRERLTVVEVNDWNEDLSSHFQGAAGVVSCLGNRQPFIGGWCSHQGNQAVIQTNPKRVVVLTSVGVEEDWPPISTFFLGRAIMTLIFTVLGRKMFRDLTLMERAYRATTEMEYLLVRPVGIGEEVVPCNKWLIQDTDDFPMEQYNMAKLDVARYLVEEALVPTQSKKAVFIGAAPKENESQGE